MVIAIILLVLFTFVWALYVPHDESMPNILLAFATMLLLFAGAAGFILVLVGTYAYIL